MGGESLLRIPDREGSTPLEATSSSFLNFEHPHRNPKLLPWLIIHGAANGEHGHFDLTYFLGRPRLRAAVLQSLKALLRLHGAFTRLVLPAAFCLGRFELKAATAIYKYPRLTPKKSAPPCPLAVLGGHESTLLKLVSEFVGLPTGRSLRNLREAVDALVLMELPSSYPSWRQIDEVDVETDSENNDEDEASEDCDFDCDNEATATAVFDEGR